MYRNYTGIWNQFVCLNNNYQQINYRKGNKKCFIHISNQVNLVKKLSVEAFNKVHIVLNEIGTFYISVGRLRDFSKLVDKGYYFAFRPKVFQQNLTTI